MLGTSATRKLILASASQELNIYVFDPFVVMDKDCPPVARLLRPANEWGAVKEEPLGFDFPHYRLVGEHRHAAKVSFQRVAGAGV